MVVDKELRKLPVKMNIGKKLLIDRELGTKRK